MWYPRHEMTGRVNELSFSGVKCSGISCTLIKFEFFNLAALVRLILLSFFLFSFVGTGFTQHAKQYSFRHFSVSNGLASNTVSAAVQDGDGYIWIATVNGLQRYDGNSFLTFRANDKDPSSLPSTRIIALFIDRKKKLWVLGDNFRIGTFDTRKFVFREVPITDKKNLFPPIQFLELPTGELLLKAHGLLYLYKEADNQFIPANQLFPLPDKWLLHNISWDAFRKKYWITSDSGLVQFDPITKHSNYRGHNIDKDPIIEMFKDRTHTAYVFTDAAGNVAFMSWPPTTGTPTILRYNNKSARKEAFTLIPQLSYHEINGFLQQRNGRLWVYGMPFFMEWTDENQPFSPLVGENLDEPRIKYDYAYHAFEDRESNIWISTDNGVYVFNPEAQIFNTYGLLRPKDKAPKEKPVTAVTQLKDGKIFIGAWGSGGLYCYDNDFKPLPLPSAFSERAKTYTVWDMGINSKNKALWITLQSGGVVVYDPKANKVTELYPDVFGKSTIRQVDDDTLGNMWFGTQNGKLIKWDYIKSGGDPSKGYELVHQANSLILKVHYDYKGFIWVGTEGEGLLKIDTRTNQIVKRFTQESPPGERLFDNSPSDMTYYDDSTLIVTAGCINIVNTKTNTISYLGVADGLPSNTAASVENDSKGILWVGMTNGICRVNLQKKLISYYDRRDGIAYDKFSKTGVQELLDGRLVFFTEHNFLVFDPAAFGQRNRPAKPYLTSFRLGGKPLSIDSLLKARRVTLNYDNTSIGIDFSALSYLQQTKVHYYYMLENLDKDWIHSDKPMEVVYNYLPPGNYVFKVKSENADGMTGPEMASLPIIVRAPFWNTWWFYGLVILLIITILYIIDKERLNKRASIRQMRREIAGNLHSEISKTLSNINVLSEMAKIKADKNIEQSKEFIGQISSKSRYMMEAMDDMLWSIDPQNDSMKKTMLRIKELTDGMRSSYDVDIDLIVDHKVQTLELDMKLRHEIFFFYKESMTFLLDHTSCSQIFVNINQVKTKMLIEILSECQMTEDFKSRFQKMIARRAEALSGTVDVIADSRSFSVVLYLPLK